MASNVPRWVMVLEVAFDGLGGYARPAMKAPLSHNPNFVGFIPVEELKAGMLFNKKKDRALPGLSVIITSGEKLRTDVELADRKVRQ